MSTGNNMVVAGLTAVDRNPGTYCPDRNHTEIGSLVKRVLLFLVSALYIDLSAGVVGV